MKSILVQLQADCDAGRSIIQHWRINETEKILIPVIAIENQKQISEFIQKSFSLRKQSRHLLQMAKEAVEMAIELGEEKAVEFINKVINFQH